MRKTLIFGSLLAVFLMLMLPAVSAAESKVVQSANTSPYLFAIQDSISAVGAKYANDPSPQTFFLLTLAILFLKLLRWGVVIIGTIVVLTILRIIRGNNNSTGLAC